MSSSEFNYGVIMVDIQPAFMNFIKPMDFCALDALLSNAGDVKIIYVSKKILGEPYDELWSIKKFVREYLENFYFNGISSPNYIEKGYGYYRNLMDEGVYSDIIVEMIKYMREHEIDHYDQIPDSVLSEMLGGFDLGDFYDFPIFLMEHDVDLGNFDEKIDMWYVVGGGRHECLEEVCIQLKSFDISHSIQMEFVY